MIISNKTQTLDFSEDINDLLCQIDVKLASEAKGKLDAGKYGAKICVDEDAFFTLSKFREILHQKAKNSKCLCNYLIDDIISSIKSLINKN